MDKDEQNSRHEKWQAIIKEQEASGLSQTQFCKERNISSAKLGYYRSVLKPKQPQMGSFSPVAIKQASYAVCFLTPKKVSLQAIKNNH